MALFISSRSPGTKHTHTHSHQHPTYTPVCSCPCTISRLHKPSTCLGLRFATSSNFSHAPAVNQKINWAFFPPLRLLNTNQLRQIYCNKDASALAGAQEMLQTSVIRFSSEGKKGSSERSRAFVFIEWLLCEVHPCLVTPSLLPVDRCAPACKVLQSAAMLDLVRSGINALRSLFH